jgi:starch synthase
MSTLNATAQPHIQSLRSVNGAVIGSATVGKRIKRPRILIVTPELNSSQYLSQGGSPAPRAKAGGLADVCTLLFDSLAQQGADVHVVMPNFRRIFRDSSDPRSKRLHLCQDREFFYRKSVYDGCEYSNRKAALVFQRDVIHHVIPKVKPDIVHCHDWMTGLVPAAARSMGIKSLFTIHNIHDEKATLAEIEDRGIDAARFWQHLHYQSFPSSYDESRSWNEVNFMSSAIHAADDVNTVSRTFLHELMEGRHPGSAKLTDVLRGKAAFGRAAGIVNAPDPSLNPASDPLIAQNYSASNHRAGKVANKLKLQKMLGLEIDAEAPVLFWPSRLDPVQKGCQLLGDILFRVVSDYMALGLQVVFVADGPFKEHFERIADMHGLRHRIAVAPFNEGLSRQAFAGSDYVVMPSSYEPCGLAQMAGLKYGSLPIVFNTGGLRDTVRHIDFEKHTGNGFLFDYYDASGLRWAIDQAMQFHIRPVHERESEVERIMIQSAEEFAPHRTLESYIDIYQRLAGKTLFR